MTYTIDRSRLSGVPFVPAADHGGALVVPRFIVIHYTGGSREAPAIGRLTFKDDTYVSAHLLVGPHGVGHTTQMVPFDAQAYHVGESLYSGLRRLNSCSIGIELVNPGYRRTGTPSEREWATKRLVHHIIGGPLRDWYLYPTEQIEEAAQICAALMRHYGSIQQIVGHDEVAWPRGRKVDPGPAFPMVDFREHVKRLTHTS